MQQSATNTCDRYSALSTDCLIANDNDHTVCADSLFGYNDCHNYTSVISETCAFSFRLMSPQNAGLRLLWLLLFPPRITSRMRQRTASAAGSRHPPTDKHARDRRTT